MKRQKFSREYKLAAVKQVRDRGVSCAQVARDLGIGQNVLTRWMREEAADPVQAFPGQGQMKADQAEMERLKREIVRCNVLVQSDQFEVEERMSESVPCGSRRVTRLMQQSGLLARRRRRRQPLDTGERNTDLIAANVLDRQFQAAAPNQRWAADFTYLWTNEGWLYVAAVLDLYSRYVVGWSMQPQMKAQLVSDAMLMAIWRRRPGTALLHHSDRGSQYTSEQFQSLLMEHGVRCSMSRSVSTPIEF